MPEDERPITVGEFRDLIREFKDEFRLRLTALEGSISALNKGQNDLALQIAQTRIDAVKSEAALQTKLVEARAVDSNQITRIDSKTGIIWAVAGAIGTAALIAFINMLMKAPK